VVAANGAGSGARRPTTITIAPESEPTTNAGADDYDTDERELVDAKTAWR
jgi:hypothetical protein